MSTQSNTKINLEELTPEDRVQLEYLSKLHSTSVPNLKKIVKYLIQKHGSCSYEHLQDYLDFPY